MALIAATGKLLPKFIPSFAWFLEGVVTKGFGKQQALRDGRHGHGPPQVCMDPADEAMWDEIFAMTAASGTTRRSRKAAAPWPPDKNKLMELHT